LRIEICAAVVAASLLASCGGRSNLDAGDYVALDPAVTAGNGSGNGNGNGSGGGNGNASETGNGNGNGNGTPDPGPGPDPTPDVNCTPHNAKGGMACTLPCVTTCGYYDLGTKACDCVSGVFVSCHCPRPWDYQGRTTAPPCDTPDGRTHWIDNTACVQKWTQCIGSDPVSGTNPRGCVCLTDPVNGRLEWTCGSTNKWFLPE
jgi:hypothetical protein